MLRDHNRDAGRAIMSAPESPPYPFDDMADDATRILAPYGIVAPHLVGLSMGGLVAQLVAVRHPASAAVRTVISSSRGLPGSDRINRPRIVEFAGCCSSYS